MRFQYHRPSTIEEAVALLDEDCENRRVITFGSDLLVWAKTGVRKPEEVVDLTGIEDISEIESDEAGVTIGAGVGLAELGRSELIRERFPALASATTTMGSVQLREGASLGGNVCTASPAGDTGPPLLAYDATMIIAGSCYRRDVAARDFYLGPGKTDLEPGEILAWVKLPWPPQGAVGAFRKGARRAAVDLALVSVAGVAFPDETTESGVGLRLALGAVAPTPVRAAVAEELVSRLGLPDTPSGDLGRKLVDAVREDARPIDDIRASAAYRRDLLGVLTADLAVELAAGLSREEDGR